MTQGEYWHSMWETHEITAFEASIERDRLRFDLAKAQADEAARWEAEVDRRGEWGMEL